MTDRPSIISRLATAMGSAAETDSWFFRRLTVYLTITGCFALIVHESVRKIDQETARLTINAAFWLWGVALVLHVLGPSSEKLLTALAQRFTGSLPTRRTSKPKEIKS